MEKEKRFVNVLLVGRPGVGKSSFINAFAIYLRYSTLAEALQGEREHRIPTTFNIFGYKETNGEENRCFSTKEVADYIFDVKNVKFRLIDTAGIIFQNNKHHEEVTKAIIAQIAKYGHINAVAFVLSCDSIAIIQQFKDYVEYLLSCMNKSTFQNVIFIYPQGTRPTMVFLTNITSYCKQAGVKIPLSNTNIFILNTSDFSLRLLKDNFRGIKFEEEDFELLEKSWTQQVMCCQKLIEYVVGDGKITGLKPHFVRETIEDIFIFLADLLCSIVDNLFILDFYKKRVVKDVTMVPLITFEKALKSNKAVYICKSLICTPVQKFGKPNIDVSEIPCQINSSNIEGNCITCNCAVDLHRATKYLKKMVVRSLNLKDKIASYNDELSEILNVQNFELDEAFWNEHHMDYKKLKQLYYKNTHSKGNITFENVVNGLKSLRKLDWIGAAIKNVIDSTTTEDKVKKTASTTKLHDENIESQYFKPEYKNGHTINKASTSRNVETETETLLKQERKDDITTLKLIVEELLGQQENLRKQISSLQQLDKYKEEATNLIKEQAKNNKVENFQQEQEPSNKYRDTMNELIAKYDLIQAENKTLKLEVIQMKSYFLPQQGINTVNSKRGLESEQGNESHLTNNIDNETEEESVKNQNLTKEINMLKQQNKKILMHHKNINKEICTVQELVKGIKDEFDLIKEQVATNQKVIDLFEHNNEGQIATSSNVQHETFHDVNIDKQQQQFYEIHGISKK